jgi:hypothetical protein
MEEVAAVEAVVTEEAEVEGLHHKEAPPLQRPKKEK